MSGICTHVGGRANTNIMTFCCDTELEVQDLPTMTEHGKGVFEDYKQTCPMGSECHVGNEGGDLLIYKLFSFGWKKLN